MVILANIIRAGLAVLIVLPSFGCSTDSDEAEKVQGALSPREIYEQKRLERASAPVLNESRMPKGHKVFLNGVQVPSDDISGSAQLKVKNTLASQGLRTGLVIEDRVKSLIIVADGVATSPVPSDSATSECVATSGLRAFKNYKEMTQGLNIKGSTQGSETDTSSATPAFSNKVVTAGVEQDYRFSSSSRSSRIVRDGRAVDRSIAEISFDIGGDLGCSYRWSAERNETVWICDVDPISKIFNSQATFDQSSVVMKTLITEISSGHCASAFAFEFQVP